MTRDGLIDGEYQSKAISLSREGVPVVVLHNEDDGCGDASMALPAPRDMPWAVVEKSVPLSETARQADLDCHPPVRRQPSRVGAVNAEQEKMLYMLIQYETDDNCNPCLFYKRKFLSYNTCGVVGGVKKEILPVIAPK